MMEDNKNFNGVDISVGMLAGVAAYKFGKEILWGAYKNGGGIVRTGCFILELYLAVEVYYKVRNKTKQMRTKLKEIKEV